MDSFSIGYCGILGMVIGSFLNVCIYRIPREESLVWPGSHCPCCNRKLTAAELVPVIGFLMLKGRCRTCGIRISARYPMVEALTGLAFLWAAINAQTTLDFIGSALFLSGLIVIFLIDYDHWIIPNAVVFPLLAAALIISGLKGMFLENLLTAAGGYAGFFAIRIIGTIAAKQEAMGQGDVKMAAMMGAFLGWRLLLAGFFIAFLVGAIVSIALILYRRSGVKDEIPFGPMLAIGGAIAMISGPEIIDWYGNLISRLWSL